MDIRVSAYVVLQRSGTVLLTHWNEGGARHGWTMPGGGLEPGEHPADAARRELTEETGYEVELGGVLGVASIVVPGEARLAVGRGGVPLHQVGIVYTGRITGGELRREIGGSTDDVAWVPLGDVPGLHRVQLVDEVLALAGLL